LPKSLRPPPPPEAHGINHLCCSTPSFPPDGRWVHHLASQCFSQVSQIFPSLLILIPTRTALPPRETIPQHGQALPAQPSARALLSIIVLLYFAHYALFSLHGLIKLRSLCNLTASLSLRTGAPAAFVVNHLIKNTGQKLLLCPLLPINLSNRLFGPFFTCSMHQGQMSITGTFIIFPSFPIIMS